MLTWLIANKKLLGYAGGALTLLVTLYQLHGHIYDSGYQSAVNEITAQHNAALEKQREQYEKQIEESLATIQANHDSEIERVKNEREIITKVEKVIEYVDKEIIVKSECDVLASDIVGLLVEATNIINTSAKTDKD